MSANYSSVTLLGNVVRDPEIKKTDKAFELAVFDIAVNHKFTVGAEKREETAYVPVVFYGAVVATIEKYVHRGDPVFVVGRLQQQTWTSKGEEKRSRLRVVGDTIQLLGARSRSESHHAPATTDEFGQTKE